MRRIGFITFLLILFAFFLSSCSLMQSSKSNIPRVQPLQQTENEKNISSNSVVSLSTIIRMADELDSIQCQEDFVSYMNSRYSNIIDIKLDNCAELLIAVNEPNRKEALLHEYYSKDTMSKELLAAIINSAWQLKEQNESDKAFKLSISLFNRAMNSQYQDLKVLYLNNLGIFLREVGDFDGYKYTIKYASSLQCSNKRYLGYISWNMAYIYLKEGKVSLALHYIYKCISSDLNQLDDVLTSTDFDELRKQPTFWKIIDKYRDEFMSKYKQGFRDIPWGMSLNECKKLAKGKSSIQKTIAKYGITALIQTENILLTEASIAYLFSNDRLFAVIMAFNNVTFGDYYNAYELFEKLSNSLKMKYGEPLELDEWSSSLFEEMYKDEDSFVKTTLITLGQYRPLKAWMIGSQEDVLHFIKERLTNKKEDIINFLLKTNFEFDMTYLFLEASPNKSELLLGVNISVVFLDLDQLSEMSEVVKGLTDIF
ncbi:TPR end-of-group domain-containing protein [Kosmotoga pacifica]|uniref:Uncharacterized protein n=1 Tax=Kosmotoga pacifica TaxID=1330330 RepID=A0A0G2ZD47_9BACT|nr:hypothetical protein [Kosmotoga pacifica]AKI96738.1 hypothetical protein IX53_01650 [Kosmotoga pacifica]